MQFINHLLMRPMTGKRLRFDCQYSFHITILHFPDHIIQPYMHSVPSNIPEQEYAHFQHGSIPDEAQ